MTTVRHEAAGEVTWRIRRRGALEVWKPTVSPAVFALDMQTLAIAFSGRSLRRDPAARRASRIDPAEVLRDS